MSDFTTPVAWTPTGVPSYSQEWEHLEQHPHRPVPDPATGGLLIDPEVRLKALGFGLDISFYYSSAGTEDGPAGKRRNVNIFQSMDASISGGALQLVEKQTGGMQQYQFSSVGTTGFTTAYEPITSMVSTTLTYNSDVNEITEYYADGMRAVYGTFVSASSEYRLKRVVDPSGHQHTYSYVVLDSVPYLQTIEVPGGNLLTLTYSSSVGTSLLSGIEDWGNREWFFAYDANRQLVSMTTPTGCVTKYAYTAVTGGPAGSILYSIEDPRGFVTSYSYSGARVVAMHLGSAVWNYHYDDPNSRTVITNPAGGKTTYTFNEGRTTKIETPDGVIESLTYNIAGWVSQSIKQMGVSMSWAYNRVGLLGTITDALANTTIYRYDTEFNLTTIVDQLGRVWSLTYYDDMSFPLSMRKLKESINPLGNRTTYSWDSATKLVKTIKDPRGLVTTHNYDAIGNLVSIVNPDGGVVTNSYDVLNRLIQTIDPLGRKTDFQYDEADQMTARIGPYVVEADAPRWSYVFDSCLLAAEIDPLGNRTSYSYGRYGNRTLVLAPDLSRTTYQYDDMGYLTTTIDAMGFTMIHEYDLAKRVTTSIDQLGYKTVYKFDAAGRRTTLTDANAHSAYSQFDERDNLTTVTDAMGNVTTLGYDAVGRQIRVTDPLGNSSQTIYDEAGRIKATVDPLGNRTTYSFDAAGNMTTVIDANGNMTSNSYTLTSNRIVSVTDGNGNTTGYSYDLAGQQVESIDPAGGRITIVYTPEGWRQALANQSDRRTTTSYDRKGRAVTVINPRLRVKTLAYDVMDRLVSVGYANGEQLVYGYDLLGRRTTMIDSGGVTTYIYSMRGDLLEQTFPGLLRLQMGYDAVQNRTTLIDPDAGTFTYKYNAMDRLVSLTDAASGVVTIAYDGSGRRNLMRLPNGSWRSYEYDSSGQLTTQIERDPTLDPIATIVNTYDKVGNRISQNRDGVLTTWAYDDGYRLIRQEVANASANATFAYDSRNNLIVKHHQGVNPMTFTVDSANQLVTMLQGTFITTFAYDDNGNLILERNRPGATLSWSFAYDDEDRLVVERQINITPNPLNTFSYTGDGLRRSMHMSGGNLTTFVWDGTDYLQQRS